VTVLAIPKETERAGVRRKRAPACTVTNAFSVPASRTQRGSCVPMKTPAYETGPNYWSN
jgi:hypothetical protein